MDTIKDLAADMLRDMYEQSVRDDVLFTTAQEFVDYVFAEANTDNALPGYESAEAAMQVLTDDKATVDKILEERGKYIPDNPFADPAGFLVFCVEYTAAKMVNNNEFDMETGELV